MAGTSLFFDILARDHASATFNKVGNAAAALGKRTDQASKSHAAFGKIVRWTGGMLSAYGVATYLKSSVQEYAKAEAAQNKLANSYQRFPKMQNATLQSFKDLNSQLQMHTRFDDDDAAAMQANLARFDLTGKQVQKLTPLVADLAQVQGTDLVTAGSAMGKAFLGNTRALKALGISYTATGNKAKDYRNIVDLINKKVGGESTKANQTAAVKLKMLENQWGELKETVGAAVLPAFNKLVEVAGPAVQNLASVVQRNGPQIKQTFEDIWGAVRKVANVGKGLWDGFSSMDPGTRDLLMTLATGTWAVGKIKSSALGQGIGAIFGGLKTITAGNVTVVGKSVTGGVGGGGGKRGGGAAGGIFASLAVLAGIPVIDSLSKAGDSAPGLKAFFDQLSRAKTAKGLTSQLDDVVFRMRKLAEPSLYDRAESVAGSFANLLGSSNTSRNNAISQLGDFDKALTKFAGHKGNMQAAKSVFDQLVQQAKAAGMTEKQVGDLLPRFTKLRGEFNKKWVDENQARSLDAQADRYKALAKSVKDVPAGKKVTVTDGGSADKAHSRVKLFGIAIAGLKGRNVKVNESGADASRNRVKNLGGAIGVLKGKRVRVDQTGAEQAKTAVDNLRATMSLLQSKTVDIVTRYRTEGGGPGKPVLQASGGYITGPGTATSDSIPARLSNGEFVMQAAAVDHYGVGMMHALNARRFAKGGSAKKAKDLAKELAQAKHEANRQKQIAAQVERLGLGDTAISYLGGLSSQAALKALQKPGALRKAARKASALSDLQNSRQAAKDKKAQAAEDAKQAAEDAAAAVAEAAQKEKDAQASVRDAIDQTASSYRSFASIATTSYDTVEEAQSKLTDATQKVTDTQAKFDYAGNDRDRAAAAKELADALAAQSAAQQGLNAAGKPTTSGIRANMASKLSRLRDFSSAVKQLKANGLNAVTLADILQMGPDQGYDFAKALLDGGLSDINDLQNQITAESASLGLTSSGINSAATTAIGQANAAAGGLNVALVPAPVTLNLDGQAIASALLTYQRQQGG